MKILGGQFKGRNFYMPKDIRPTQNLVRKAIFDVLGINLDGLEFLELFAGSGAVGLEALSRGAKKLVLVEKEPQCIQAIEENVKLLKVNSYESGTSRCEIIQGDALMTIKLFARQQKKFDIVFIDPPYGRELAKKTLKTLEAYDILQPNCMVIIQHEEDEILPETQGRFLLFRKKNYGHTVLSMYQ